MREINLFVLYCLLSSTGAYAATMLDERLDSLYDEVATRFAQNPWFKNSADPDVNPRGAGNSAAVPEYQMLDRDLFKNAMKSYCVLLESPAVKQVPNRAHYGIVNFSQASGERRLFIYDVPSQSIIHNIWTSHGAGSHFGFWYGLRSSGIEDLSGYDSHEVAINRDDSDMASLFSNRNGSNQSSAGMAVADTQTYFSTEKQWTALRMSGLDGALNSNLRARAVVLHEWGYNGQNIRWYHEAPLSEGCPMLPREGTYQGVGGTEIAKLLMRELYGAPILFYHERMNAQANESAYQEQLQTLKNLHAALTENMSELQSKHGWQDTDRNRYETVFSSNLDNSFGPLINETYKYFQNRSRFYGVEPKNAPACMKALGL